MNLLIVDDEELEVEIVGRMVDMEALHISHIFKAYDMAGAVKILREYPVAILLCDIEMPHGSGHDLTKWIREENLRMEVIYLTAHADFGYARTSLQLGAVDYLLKPVEKEALNAALAKASARLPDYIKSAQTEKERPIVRRIQEYIKAHCGEEITRQSISEQFFIHPDHLSHIFREQTGLSFQEYIIRTRMDRAKELLRSTNLSISMIAAQTGYSNTAYLARHFKRETGKTPKEYRRKYLEQLSGRGRDSKD